MIQCDDYCTFNLYLSLFSFEQELDGRAIGVRFAEERPPRNNFGGGGGYGGRQGDSGASNDY